MNNTHQKINSSYSKFLIIFLSSIFLTACLQTAPLQGSTTDSWVEFEGYYQCAQGQTHLVLNVNQNSMLGLQMATFSFGPTPRNTNIPKGVFSMLGTFNPDPNGLIYLKKNQWISQPPGYSMVDLSGKTSADGNTFNGKVLAAGCADFSLTRKSPKIAPRTVTSTVVTPEKIDTLEAKTDEFLVYQDIRKILFDNRLSSKDRSLKIVGKKVKLNLISLRPSEPILMVNAKDQIYFSCNKRDPGFKKGFITATITELEEDTPNSDPWITLDRCVK